jgi:hypothetical protein
VFSRKNVDRLTPDLEKGGPDGLADVDVGDLNVQVQGNARFSVVDLAPDRFTEDVCVLSRVRSKEDIPGGQL